MSCDIRIYKSKDRIESQEMVLTAFVGKDGDPSIQFSIGGEFISLNHEAMLDLIETIIKRIKADPGYSATGVEREDLEYIVQG